MSTPFLVSYVLLWILVAGLFAGVFALYHHFGQMYINSREGRLAQGPKEGTVLAAVRAKDLDGLDRSLPSRDRPSLLLFTSTDCKLCKALRPDVRRLAGARRDVDLAVVCSGHPRAVAEWAAELSAAVPVVPDPRSRITAGLGIDALPFVVVVGGDGVVRGGGVVNDHDGLEIAANEAVQALPILHEPVTAERNGIS